MRTDCGLSCGRISRIADSFWYKALFAEGGVGGGTLRLGSHEHVIYSDIHACLVEVWGFFNRQFSGAETRNVAIKCWQCFCGRSL